MPSPSPLRKLGHAAAAAVAGLWSRWGGTGWGYRFRTLLPGATFDHEREAGDLWANSTLGICIAWLGKRFPKPRLRVAALTAKGDRRPLGRHRLVDLWGRPNGFYSRRALEKAIGLSLVVDGNAFVYVARAKSGEPAELWWLPHFNVSPLWPADGRSYIAAWQVRVDGVAYEVPVEDVVHIRDGIDPRNERLGMSAVKAQLREVCTDNEASGFSAALLRNSGVPGLMIVPDDEKLRPTREDAEQIKRSIKDGFAGDGRGEAMVLGGRYKVVQIGFSPEQLRLDKLPQTAMAKLAAAAGVPLMAAGLPDPGKTYSNLEQALAIGWGTVEDIQELIAEALRWSLLPEWSDPYATVVEYEYGHITELQEVLKSRSERVRGEWKDGVRKKGEARAELGLDDDPAADHYFPGTEAPAALPGPDGATATGAAVVQDTALNGAQIASLLTIVEQVVSGMLPAGAAAAMIAAAFPNLSEAQIAAIIGPADAFDPPPPPAAPPGKAPAALPAPAAKGKMAGGFPGQGGPGCGGAREYLWAADGVEDRDGAA